jgi:hypothetical protein
VIQQRRRAQPLAHRAPKLPQRPPVARERRRDLDEPPRRVRRQVRQAARRARRSRRRGS